MARTKSETKSIRLLFLSTDFEPFVKDVNIDISYSSDHSPVYLVLQFYNQTKGKGTWKFNNSLLQNKEYVTEIKECIKETINQYSRPIGDDEPEYLLNPHLFWELLKCLIRNKTISFSSYLKKKNEKFSLNLNLKCSRVETIKVSDLNRFKKKVQ